MDFSQTDEQRELAALTRRILAGRATPERLAELEADGDPFHRALWAELADAGILAAALPESAGGAGLGLIEQCPVLAEIGRAVAPVPYLASIVLGAGAIARFGTPDQQKRWAVPAARGELVLAAALSEDDGDDPRAPAATAEPVPEGWLLSGTKTAVPAAPGASLMLVPATTPYGVAVFLAGPDDDGVTIQRQHVTGGASAGRVTLSGARIAAERMLGAPGDGPRITDWLTARGTVGLCALQLGAAERALELTAEYARTREQFGRPIGSFQAVAQRLADAYIDVEAIRLAMWQAAWELSADPEAETGGTGMGDAATAVATAKFWAADAGHRVRGHCRPRPWRHGHRHQLPGASLLHRRETGRVRPRRCHSPAPQNRRRARPVHLSFSSRTAYAAHPLTARAPRTRAPVPAVSSDISGGAARCGTGT